MLFNIVNINNYIWSVFGKSEVGKFFFFKMSSSHSAHIEALDKEDFDTWKLQVKALLVKNDTREYVSREKNKPTVIEGNGASEALAQAWDVANKKAHSDLVTLHTIY